MAVRAIFPTFLFHRNFLQENLGDRGYSEEYSLMLRGEMDAMRRRDPIGRQLSNQYTGWQSKDGCERNPTFQKCMNKIVGLFNEEVLPFHGLDPSVCKLTITNSWANINDKGAWNAPHLHNGCWYSGVLYIHADGDEGRLTMVDVHSKVVADFPASERTPTSFPFEPVTGECILFPSGAMHMVEPNPTDKERYSISFNTFIEYNREGANMGVTENYDRDELLFDLDEKGNIIR
tara:strand:- start:646 stop:1344 length:699 start_codon:yes stop_codon:yes gene_type:complete